MLGLETGQLLVQKKVIVAMQEHELGEVPCEWLSLHVEVPEHIAAAPAFNQLDGVADDAQ